MVVLAHLMDFLICFPDSKICMISVSNVFVVSHREEEGVVMTALVVHFKSDFLHIVLLFYSDVQIAAIHAFYNHKLITL